MIHRHLWFRSKCRRPFSSFFCLWHSCLIKTNRFQFFANYFQIFFASPMSLLYQNTRPLYQNAPAPRQTMARAAAELFSLLPSLSFWLKFRKSSQLAPAHLHKEIVLFPQVSRALQQLPKDLVFLLFVGGRRNGRKALSALQVAVEGRIVGNDAGATGLGFLREPSHPLQLLRSALGRFERRRSLFQVRRAVGNEDLVALGWLLRPRVLLLRLLRLRGFVRLRFGLSRGRARAAGPFFELREGGRSGNFLAIFYGRRSKWPRGYWGMTKTGGYVLPLFFRGICRSSHAAFDVGCAGHTMFRFEALCPTAAFIREGIPSITIRKRNAKEKLNSLLSNACDAVEFI